MIRFQCPTCRYILQVDSGPGTKVKCPRCTQRLMVPSPVPARTGLSDAGREPVVPLRPSPYRPLRLRQAWPVVLVALLALGIWAALRHFDSGKKNGEAGVVQRRTQATDEDLRKQLLSVPEAGLDQAAASDLYAPVLGEQGGGGPQLGGRRFRARRGAEAPPSLDTDVGPRFLADLARSQKRPEWACFPWRMGADCQLGKEAAERLHVLSTHLRACLRASTPGGDVRPDADRLRDVLLKGSSSRNPLPFLRGVNATEIKPSEWQEPGAIPALMQMLQAENTPIRLLLVELLSNIKGKEAAAALASRALFDLSAQVREKAVQALPNRPASDYRQVLLDGLRHPWPAAADHAAEALVALKDRDALPVLVDLLNEPDPALPFAVQLHDNEVLAIRELVRINHMSNCMLCHAPSLSAEHLVRGRVPIPGEDPPPLYYAEQTGLFIRATTTYLRQDFSVVQPVAVPGKWPENQRFDYLTRIRLLSKPEELRFMERQKDIPKPDTYPQRDAVLHTLKGLTGKDPGTTAEDWKPLLKTIAPAKETAEEVERRRQQEMARRRSEIAQNRAVLDLREREHRLEDEDKAHKAEEEARRRAEEQEEARRRLAHEEEARRIAAQRALEEQEERARQQREEEAKREARQKREEEAKREAAQRSYLMRRSTYLAAIEQAGSPDMEVKEKAALHLTHILLHDPDGEVKVKAARALARTGKAAEAHLPALEKLPPADDPLLQAEIKHAVEVIRLAVKVADPVARYQKLITQDARDFPEAMRKLQAAKQEVLAALEIAMKGSPVAGECTDGMQVLFDAAGRTQTLLDKGTREKACACLVSLVKTRALEADVVVSELVKLIGKAGGLQAIDALGQLGEAARAAVPALKALESDSHRSVRETAAEALRKIEKPSEP